jgi:Na+/melibiose symporter-like transporter
MSRRWSILGLTTAVSVAVAGLLLDRVGFPFNYQVMFLGLSAGGLVSFYFSSHIDLPEADPQATPLSQSSGGRLRSYFKLVMSQPQFVRFSIQRFVFLTGTALAIPLFPLYFVREIHASDAWIGAISTIQTAILLVGYFLWTRGSQLRGSRFVLLWTTFGLSLYPALIAFTHRVEWIAFFAGFAGIFQAGVDLVFFDELMKTFPVEYSATFVALAQSLQYLSAFIAPLIGTALSGTIGLSGALLVSSVLRLAGFGLFALWRGGEAPVPQAAPSPAEEF